jgi:cell volume regulation protein A
MFLVDRIILVGGALLLIGIVSSKLSMRMGLPVLVLFLIVGMLAGEEGIGGIEFNDFAIAHAIGTFALAAILFDGGLQTPIGAIRAVWKPSVLLATVGVLITAVVTGLAACYILDVPLLDGLLLGSIVGSTDAAAVFSVLRSQGLRLRERIAATLEVESGSNDPMAIFLTVGLIEVLLERMAFGVSLLQLFALQMVMGSVVGLGIGWLSVRLINRIRLESAGLYPVLTGACGLIAFGLASLLGGSGFLAIYLCGIVIGNSRIVFQRGSFLFHDAAAWMGQICMFVVLGLLSTPSEVFGVAGQGLLISAVLIFIARPIAVMPLLLPFGFSIREHLFISWVGLKGAVPIILATFPPLFGLPEGVLLFNVVFFVVLVSATTQGWTLPLLASRLGLQEAGKPEPPVSLEIVALNDVDAQIVDYTVEPGSRAAGRRLSQLALPDGIVVALISRGNALIPPRGSTTFQPGDHVFVVMQAENRPLVDRAFGRGRLAADIPTAVEFPLLGTTTAAQLREFYDISLDAPDEMTLDELIRHKLNAAPETDLALAAGGVILRVRQVDDGRITWVGLGIPDSRATTVV